MMAGLLRVALALIIAVYSLYRLRKLSDRSTLIGKQYHYALYMDIQICILQIIKCERL